MDGKVEVNLNPLVNSAEIYAAIGDGLEGAGKEIVALASVLAPKDTGALSRSGKVERNGSEIVVSFGNDLPDIRAVVMEYGGVFVAAQPFLLPAIRTVDVAFFIKDALDERLG